MKRIQFMLIGMILSLGVCARAEHEGSAASLGGALSEQANRQIYQDLGTLESAGERVAPLLGHREELIELLDRYETMEVKDEHGYATPEWDAYFEALQKDWSGTNPGDVVMSPYWRTKMLPELALIAPAEYWVDYLDARLRPVIEFRAGNPEDIDTILGLENILFNLYQPDLESLEKRTQHREALERCAVGYASMYDYLQTMIRTGKPELELGNRHRLILLDVCASLAADFGSGVMALEGQKLIESAFTAPDLHPDDMINRVHDGVTVLDQFLYSIHSADVEGNAQVRAAVRPTLEKVAWSEKVGTYERVRAQSILERWFW